MPSTACLVSFGVVSELPFIWLRAMRAWISLISEVIGDRFRSASVGDLFAPPDAENVLPRLRLNGSIGSSNGAFSGACRLPAATAETNRRLTRPRLQLIETVVPRIPT